MLENSTTEKDFISEIENYKKQLLHRTEMQDLMKNCNVIIRKAKGKNCTSELIAQGLSEAVAFKIQSPDF